MPDAGLNGRTAAGGDPAMTGPPSFAHLAGLVAALCAAEAELARTALGQMRRMLLLAIPGLLVAVALLMVAVGQASFALVAGLQAAGLGAAPAHLGTAVFLAAAAGLALWAVRRWFVQAITAAKHVMRSLRADLELLSPSKTGDSRN